MNSLQLLKELSFKATRSSGSGGQHVNKVSTKVELYFHIANSTVLSTREKELISSKLTNRITKEGYLTLSVDTTRSQHKNKELAIKRFFELIKQSLVRPKIRRATKPTRASKVRKSESKKRNSQKKAMRKKPNIE